MFTFETLKSDIDRICQKYRVKKLTAFGSVLSADEFNENSDIDLLVELDSPENGIIRYMRLKFELEDLFRRRVDLVMPKAIKNPRLKDRILSETRNIYAA